MHGEPLEPSPVVKRPDPPPLRIHHLLAWMSVTAVLISVCLWFDRTARNGPPIQDQTVIASLILGAVAISGALTFAACGLHWRRQGYAFPASPGEWLLVVLVACFCGFVAVILGLFSVFLMIGGDGWHAIYYLVTGAGMLFGWVLLNANAKRQHPYGNRVVWRVTFDVIAYSPFLIYLTGWLAVIVGAAIACVLWAAWIDVRYPLPRSWLHWFGVAVTVALGIAIIGAWS